jgi:hypothetical protein
MSQPVQVFTVIVLVSLPTVMFGGFSLLQLMTAGKLTIFNGPTSVQVMPMRECSWS